MSKRRPEITTKQRTATNDRVDALASKVLSVLVSRHPAHGDAVQPMLLDRLIEAVQVFDQDARNRLVGEMIDAGISAETIIDRYIPAASRKLGDDWCVDSVSFADVTIAVARLQGMLRDLEKMVATNVTIDPFAPNVLMIVREEEYHTLGAMVATSQMRRMGLSVKLQVGHSDQTLRDLLSNKVFDMIMISASGGERLERLRDLVKNMKTCSERTPPIVIGGSVLESYTDVKTLTGADHIARDPYEALRLCGLKMPAPAVGSNGTRS